MQQDVLTKKEVCDLLKISLSKLNIHVKRGDIEYLKLGNRVLFYDTQIFDFLESCRHKGVA